MRFGNIRTLNNQCALFKSCLLTAISMINLYFVVKDAVLLSIAQDVPD